MRKKVKGPANESATTLDFFALAFLTLWSKIATENEKIRETTMNGKQHQQSLLKLQNTVHLNAFKCLKNIYNNAKYF